MMISVIIPTYNAAMLIERSIRSVLTQRDVTDFEIIVVDDCSTDNTVEVVRGIGDERIRIFRQSENRGPAAARNRGLAEASGVYCAFLDGDDFWEPDFLRETSSFLMRHSNAIAVFTGQRHNTVSGVGSIRPRCLVHKLETDIAKEGVLLPNFFTFWKEQHYLVCTGSILIRTNVLRKIGGQREDLHIGEDLELWCLLGFEGEIGFIPKVLFTSDGSSREDNKIIVWKKHMKRWKTAPSTDQWARRHPISVMDKYSDYLYVRGEVCGMLVYAAVMRGDYNLARREVQKYAAFLVGGKISSIYRIASCSIFLWYPLCWFIFLREYCRGH